jgi:hypothetical protein
MYGGTQIAKTSPLTAASKDPVRESHARDLIGIPVHPMIRDEEFPEYQKLLDGMKVKPPHHLALPSIPQTGPIRLRTKSARVPTPWEKGR